MPAGGSLFSAKRKSTNVSLPSGAGFSAHAVAPISSSYGLSVSKALSMVINHQHGHFPV